MTFAKPRLKNDILVAVLTFSQRGVLLMSVCGGFVWLDSFKRNFIEIAQENRSPVDLS